MKRLPAIEGVRAYLALWVLAAHALAYAGCEDDGIRRGLAKLLTEGTLAVDVFMAISGFVIFGLLDRGEEGYGQFVCRRFFRLYPLFAFLVLLALPLTRLDAWAVAHAGQWMRAGTLDWVHQRVEGEWQNWGWNLALHLTMLHGVARNDWLGGWPLYAFLAPAWSVSLEWQFYLVAPLAYGLAKGPEGGRVALCAVCAGLFYTGLNVNWGGGFLPMNTGFFFLGAVSYFVYKSGVLQAMAARARAGVFPVACALAVMLFLLSGKQRIFIPVCGWMVFLALLGEPESSLSARWVLPLFTNPAAQYLGRISYSIYLSHQLVIIVVQAALAWAFPQLGKLAHLEVLLAATVAGTVGVSGLLYRYVEAPGMKLGAVLAAKIRPAPEVRYA